MDQIKIGMFLRDLRKEKNLTQEQLAEKMSVSNRSVSRWETGSNMPDLDLLIELANYYEVGLDAILDGERKNEKMNSEFEETVLKVADFSSEEKRKLTQSMNCAFLIGLVAFLVYLGLDLFGLADSGNTSHFADAGLGVAFGVMITGFIMTSRYMLKIRAFKIRLLKRVQ